MFEKFPNYVFSYEGAIHYMWFKEYYREAWPPLQKYVAQDRWRIAGKCLETRRILVSRELDQRLFGGQAVGQRIAVRSSGAAPDLLYDIIGVVENASRTRSRSRLPLLALTAVVATIVPARRAAAADPIAALKE